MDISKNTNLHQQCQVKPDHTVQRGGWPHPAVQIYIWVCLTLAAPMLSTYALMSLAGILTASAIMFCATRFIILLRRTRWILFSVFLIYVYISQGESLWPQLGVFSPVADGIADGFLQLLRLLTVLAGVSILLSLLSQSQLIAGLYMLSRPLSCLGLSRERLAVRLALTLSYAENAMQDTASNWSDCIEHLLAPVPVVPGFIELNAGQLARRDSLLLAAASAALLGVWLPGGVWL